MLTANRLTTAQIHDRAARHGEWHGRQDYQGRAQDVAAGSEDTSWAWPLVDADDAYINAIGTAAICDEIGASRSEWDAICSVWCDAFRHGYREAHAESLVVAP